MKEEQTVSLLDALVFLYIYLLKSVFFSSSKKGEATAALLRRDLQNTTLTLSTPSHPLTPTPPAPPPPHAATLTATQSLHRKSHTVSHERLHAASLLTLREGRGRRREGEGEGCTAEGAGMSAYPRCVAQIDGLRPGAPPPSE